MAKLTKNLAPLFDSSISYEPGERFMYGDHMYEALEPLSGAFDSTKVSEVTLADIFKGVSSNDVKCLAPEYDVNTEYSVENLVLHDGVLYECVETTTGPFDETKWSRKYLSDVGGLNSNLKQHFMNKIVPTVANEKHSFDVGFKPSLVLLLDGSWRYIWACYDASKSNTTYDGWFNAEYNDQPLGTSTNTGLYFNVNGTNVEYSIPVTSSGGHMLIAIK